MAKQKITPDEVPIRPVDFARLYGIPPPQVYRAVHNGVFQDGAFVHPETRQTWLYPNISKKEWDLRTDPAKSSALAAGGRATAAKRGVGRPAIDRPPAPSLPPKQDGDSMAELKRKKAIMDLQVQALNFQKMRGELVDIRKVYAALFEMGKEIRSLLLAIPDRSIDAIIGATTRTESHTILKQEIHDVLTAIAETIEREIVPKK